MYDRRLREVVVSLGGGRFMEIRILQIVGVVVGEVRCLHPERVIGIPVSKLHHLGVNWWSGPGGVSHRD